MSETKTPMNIHQKILKIADAAGVLQKTKSGFNYKYVPEEEIQAKVTACMQKYGVMLYHSIVPGTLKVQPYTYEKYDSKIKGNKTVNEFIVTADSIYTWVNVDDPTERIEVPWILVGQMEDASQSFGAAETYCNRYFLMKSLQLATSEADPDDYRSKQKEAENYEQIKEGKAAAEELEKEIQKVVDAGTKLINKGIKKEVIMDVVAKYNNKNANPSSIKSIDICKNIMDEFDTLETAQNKDLKKPTKKGDK